MRFRLGVVMGFGAGYYLGAQAGRERYEQINRTLGRVKRSDAYEAATERARDVVDMGVDRAADLLNGDGHQEPAMYDPPSYSTPSTPPPEP